MSRLPASRAAACFCALALIPACSDSKKDDGPGPIVLTDGGSLPQTDAGTSDGGMSGLEDSGITDPSELCTGTQSSAENALSVFMRCMASEASEGSKSSRLDQFIQWVKFNGGGFPLITEGHVTFLYVRDADYDAEDDAKDSAEDFDVSRRQAPIQVAGDFNNWNPGEADTLDEVTPGVFVKTLPLTVGGERWAYKFKAKDASGNDVWFSDPLSRRFDYDENGRISLVRGGASKGHLEKFYFDYIADHLPAGTRTEPGFRLVEARDIYVYLPPGYDTSSDTYPVLYMHDGNNLFDTRQPRSAGESWDVDGVEEMELSAGNIVPHIVVGIPNSDARIDEYTHVQEQEESGIYDGMTGLMGGKGDDYAEFVVKGVKPYIDGHYRTKSDFENTGILGSSLGGLISYYIAWKYPDVFKFVGGMSGTFGWGFYKGNKTVIELYGEVQNLKGRSQVYYLDAGGYYPEGGCGGRPYLGINDSELCDVDMMKAALEQAGIVNYPENPDVFPVTPADADIYHYHQAGAFHNEAAWNSRLYRALRFFFPKRNR